MICDHFDKKRGTYFREPVLFVHIPKTAGTSIRDALSKKSPLSCSRHRTKFSGQNFHHGKHNTIKYFYDNLSNNKFDNYFKFSVVRNPWDRIISIYNFFYLRHMHIRGERMYVNLKNNYDIDLNLHSYSFDEFVKNTLTIDGKKDYFHWAEIVDSKNYYWYDTQFKFLSIDYEKLSVDYVIRFENLQNDFDKVCKKIGIEELKLPYSQRSPQRKHYTKYYKDSSIKKIVEDWYGEDIEHFKYTFDNK